MKKVLSVLMSIGLTATMFAGCSAAVDETPATDGHEEMTYMSANGYQLRYSALNIESSEIDEDTVQFIYTGESSGTNTLTVTYIEGIGPDEALYDLTSLWEEQEAIQRSEGVFPGTSDKWGIRRTLSPDGEEGLYECAIAGEYNGGVLLFELAEYVSGDDTIDMAVSDALDNVLCSITYDDFEPQSMYSYYPGTYSGDGTTLTLNDDHSGTLSAQDDVEILWGSDYIMASDGSFTYNFTIEGDNLYLEYDGDWLELSSVAGGSETTETEQIVGMINPWSNAATADEAATGAGVGDFTLPDNRTDTTAGPIFFDSYFYMDGIAEAQGSIGAASMIVRKGLVSLFEEGDISGDWTDYSYVWYTTAGDTDVTCRGNEDGQAMLISWTDGDYCYSIMIRGQGDIYDTYGLADEAVAELVGVIS